MSDFAAFLVLAGEVAFQMYSSTWMRSITTWTVTARRAASARIRSSWCSAPSTRTIQVRSWPGSLASASSNAAAIDVPSVELHPKGFGLGLTYHQGPVPPSRSDHPVVHGLELVDPGAVPIHEWRPDRSPFPPPWSPLSGEPHESPNSGE
jgi:hypothetical protein